MIKSKTELKAEKIEKVAKVAKVEEVVEAPVKKKAVKKKDKTKAKE